MRHCRQCRADAVGLLGEDRGQEFQLALLPEEIDFDASERDAYRVHVERQRGEHHAAKERSANILANTTAGRPLQVAVATKGGGGSINTSATRPSSKSTRSITPVCASLAIAS